MNGIELSEKFYNTYRDSIFKGELLEYEPRVAAVLVGPGSECFGFDDEISRDHDFEAGFQLVMSAQDYEAAGMELQKAYNALPDCFMGVQRKNSSAMGAGRMGVCTIDGFYRALIGTPGVPASLQQWLSIPEYALATATNGKVFADVSGEFSNIRRKLQQGYPRDVRLKKMAARAIMMAQAGQYNFPRSVGRGDYAAASLACHEFVSAACSMIFLLNNAYMPYYKWQFRAMRSLSKLSHLYLPLYNLITCGCTNENERKMQQNIEMVCAEVIEELEHQHLSERKWEYLEPHAFAITKRIENAQIRSLHIMEG